MEKNELNPLTCSLVNDVTKSSSKGSVKKEKEMTLFLNIKYNLLISDKRHNSAAIIT